MVSSNTRKLLPKLKSSRREKKYHYTLKSSAKLRRLSIDEGIEYERKHTKRNRKQAAIAKKGRLNILRIYRRNNNVKDCKIITSDMNYIDKKYKLGKTSQICGKIKS